MSSDSPLHNKPSFSQAQAERIARECWGVETKATTLAGERDQNFLLEAAGLPRSVLKIANRLEDRSALEFQNEAMDRVARIGDPPRGPRAIPATDGVLIVEVETDDGSRWLARRLSWIDGEPLATVGYRPATLWRQVGRHLGEIDLALADLDPDPARRKLEWDSANALNVVRNLETLIHDARLRSVVRTLADRFEHAVQPVLDTLPEATIHADANDWNIIVGPADRRTGDRIVNGIIDYGDLMRTIRVAEPAIAIAYAVLDADDPLSIARTLVAAYNDVSQLSEPELEALWGMSCMRLCVSACMAAKQQAERPDDDYITISQPAVVRTLPRLSTVPWNLATAHLRHACGLEPVAAAARVRKWLSQDYGAFSRIIDGLRPDDSVVLDLGVDSPLIHGDPALNEEPALSKRIHRTVQRAGTRFGIARWDEARLLNTGPSYRTDTGEARTVHLGQDIYAPEGTPVFAPLAGTVVAFNDNDARQDYGPVMVLAHETADGTRFHTLYGHLSRSSLVGLFEGREIERGERIGTIGGVHENGGWTPHVHLQVIVDAMGMGTDFPGICRASEREIWKSFSPDPDLMLGLLDESQRAGPPSHDRILAARTAHVGPNLSLAYREPLHIARGWMQYLYDDAGRRYIDAYNNVPHVGHCHPAVVEAGARQMARLETNTRYATRLLGGYAERLADTLPEPLEVVWFVNSASEANELALRLARAHTGRKSMIVLEHAYHGNTTTLIDLSPYKHDGPGGKGPPAWVHTAPIPDVYRGLYRGEGLEAGQRYAGDVREIVRSMVEAGDPPCAFIAESCPSVGGQIVPPRGYLAAAYACVRDAGGLCIADEVQTGYGRMGTHFYAFEDQGVVPDIVVLGKPIGNGHPIGAVITTREIARSFDDGMEFFSTFGGNTVSCAIGLAVLDVVQRERLMENAGRVGKTMLDRLEPLAGRYPIVGDVRGSGFFLGIELIRDPDTLEPAGAEAAFVCDRMRERGILIGTDGPWHNVLKIRPPMPFDADDADRLATVLEELLAELPA